MDTIHLQIGKQLKRIRTARQMTLDTAAEVTGISKPMLGQIERGQSIPTVTTLWKIATGFKVPLSSFLEEQPTEYTVVQPGEEGVLLEEDGKMRAYSLFPYDPLRNVESFYIEFDGGCRHLSNEHEEGVEESVFVIKGTLRMTIGQQELLLKEKQALRFKADVPHCYHNPSGEPCSIYNTIFYPKN